jgi:hypothetical protein
MARRSREKAARLEARALAFERGAEGEERTALVVDALPSGWTAFHDVRWPHRRLANIDHIVVGPGGIFVIDSKNWSGTLSIGQGHLRQNGRSREKAVAGAADAALVVSEMVGPHAAHVTPVLCFATEFSMDGWCRDVMTCSTNSLARMLLSRPAVLGAQQVTDVSLNLDMQLRRATASAAASVTAPTGRRSRTVHPPQRPVPLAARRREPRRRSARRLFAGLALLLASLMVGPHVMATAAGWFVTVMTHDPDVSPACPVQPTSSSPTATTSHPDARVTPPEVASSPGLAAAGC